MIQQAIEQAELINDDRLRSYPGSPFFQYASREIEKISAYYRNTGYFDKIFYDKINIGIMCARELETVDPYYCDIIYDLLEKIRVSLIN